MKKILLGSLVSLTIFATAVDVSAQGAFWSYDEEGREAVIPAQCDGQFDESRGGVFMPTPDELFEQGEAFLVEQGPSRINAGYCLISAAVQGHVEAQYRLAQLYNKGIVLPQNDLVAYKWAYIAALNGHKDAEQLALMLEQFMSAEDVQLATASIQDMIPEMTAKKQAVLSEQERLLEEKQIELEKINAEIDAMLGIKFKSDVLPGQVAVRKKQEEAAQQAADNGNGNKRNVPVIPAEGIFSDKDRMK